MISIFAGLYLPCQYDIIKIKQLIMKNFIEAHSDFATSEKIELCVLYAITFFLIVAAIIGIVNILFVF